MHLAELLTAAALSGAVLAGTLTALDAGQRAWAAGARRLAAQQAARVALERLAREIRGAGRGHTAPAVAVAEPARLVLQVDVDGDRRIARRGERIAWRQAGTVLRRDAGGGAQPIADDVRRLALRYLDAAGRPTAEPAAVRTVEIALTVGAPGGPATTLTTAARVRNR